MPAASRFGEQKQSPTNFAADGEEGQQSLTTLSHSFRTIPSSLLDIAHSWVSYSTESCNQHTVGGALWR
jgi:hypothetical protein